MNGGFGRVNARHEFVGTPGAFHDYNEGMAASTTGLMTSEQFLALPMQYDENGNRIKQELIAGEIYPVPRPSRIHDIVKNQIGEFLVLFLAAHPDLGLKSLIETGFEVTDEDTFAPDVSVLKKSRLYEGGSRVLTRAPEIAIEVVSPSDTAIGLKHKIHVYLANGSKTVWVVYPEEKSVEVRTKGGTCEFTGDQPMQDEMLPGFSQPVSTFFDGL